MCKSAMSDCTVIEMVKKCDAFNKLTQGNGYVSCIKINGNPILPPLITPEKRLELNDYKKRAIDLERHFKCQKDLKTFIKKLDSCNLQLEKNVTENTNPHASFTRTLEHILSFGNDSQSHVDAFNISDISKNDNQTELPSIDNKETDVPLNSKRKKSLNLTCNIFDVTEYSDKGIIVFNDCVNETDPVDNLLASTVELDLSDICCINDEKKLETTTTSPLNTEIYQPKPRLRSNSYTLDSPSPILLEHFKKQAKQDPNNSFMFEKQFVPPKRRSLDLGRSVSNRSLDDFRCKTFSFKQQLDHNASMSSGIVADISSIRDEGDCILNGCDLTSVQKVVEDLAEKHFGPVHESKKTNVLDVQCDNIKLSLKMTKNITDLACLDSTNLELQDLPENYVKDIMEFLERYKYEQDTKLKFLRDELNKSTNNNNDGQEIQEQPNNNNEVERSDGAVKLLCCENVIDASPVESSNRLNTSTPLLIDFESDSCDNEPVIYYDSNSSFTNSESIHTLSYYEYQNSQRNLSSANCSRELFPEDPKKLEKRLKQQWAATILTAAAKGYLVRRLKRTERVKNLIQTIQEALLCAMSLHTENSDNIRPPDVELHRRLIQQVSAACYEFYEIFFSLTTKEQMALIAIDRQRLQEKSKRPKSVGSGKPNSSRSTKSHQNSFDMRQRKSLTPSYAA